MQSEDVDNAFDDHVKDMAAAQGVEKLAPGVGKLARGAGRLKGISDFWESLDAQFKEDLLTKNPNSILLLVNDIKGADLLSDLLGTVIDKYYDPDTHTFDISGHVLGVTLEDVLYLTGLPIQGKPLIYEKSLDEDAFMRVFGEEFKDRKMLTFDEGFLLVRIPKIQDMLGINLKNYPPDVIKGAPLLPWIVGEIKRKTRNHWATHDMPAIAFFSDEDITWTPYKQMACPRPGDLKSVRNLVPLIGYNCVQHHMPHNCSDQFPVLQDYNFRSLTWKPCEIPPFKKLGGGHNIDYKDLFEEQIAEWNAGKPAEAYMTRLQQKHNLFIKASEDTSDIRGSRSITKLSITQLSLCKWKLFLANKKLRQDDIFGIENDDDRANDNSFEIENDNSQLGDRANDGGGENDADRANDHSFEIENDNSQLEDRVDDGGSEKGKQEDPGSDPRTPKNGNYREMGLGLQTLFVGGCAHESQSCGASSSGSSGKGKGTDGDDSSTPTPTTEEKRIKALSKALEISQTANRALVDLIHDLTLDDY
ncbi:hypothetical protein ACET3Z_010587 [Daucus carota]